jgi:hypothetical protein
MSRILAEVMDGSLTRLLANTETLEQLGRNRSSFLDRCLVDGEAGTVQ